ncbi:MAG: glycosyl transferase [Oligoflexia bacterium]|nr:glycosyl transferase [Oligoflexia bacterium]
MNKNNEHFCTLFDISYLPYGLCLKKSLDKHMPNHILWILCMDEEVHKALSQFSLNNIRLISLNEIESKELLNVKNSRTRGEYCWTLTPFLPEFILNKEPSIKRVTYLDSDLYFFSTPEKIISELENSSASILITEHAYDPQYDQTNTSGRFCVQFLTYLNNNSTKEVLHWWQEKCLEWCFARHENGLFGDQMYLNQWPSLFGEAIKIVEQKDKTQAPWNAEYYFPQVPVFFHFHGFKKVSENKIRYFLGYKIKNSIYLYTQYYDSFLEMLKFLKRENIKQPIIKNNTSILSIIRDVKRSIFGTTLIRRYEI